MLRKFINFYLEHVRILQTFVTLCENPAKVIYLWFAFFLQKKVILHMVKNILWRCNLYFFNID